MLNAWEADNFTDLSDAGKLVYFYLCSRHRASMSLIIKTLGITQKKAERAVKELSKANLVQTEKKSVFLIEEKKTPTPRKTEPDEIFESFWTVYPRKEDKARAQKAFKNIDIAEKNKIILAAKNYATQCFVKKTEQQYIYKPLNFIQKLIYLSYINEETHYRNDSALDSILDWGVAANG